MTFKIFCKIELDKMKLKLKQSEDALKNGGRGGTSDEIWRLKIPLMPVDEVSKLVRAKRRGSIIDDLRLMQTSRELQSKLARVLHWKKYTVSFDKGSKSSV